MSFGLVVMLRRLRGKQCAASIQRTTLLHPICALRVRLPSSTCVSTATTRVPAFWCSWAIEDSSGSLEYSTCLDVTSFRGLHDFSYRLVVCSSHHWTGVPA